ncbi:MAG: winged helix-turn-helix domain-containing protein [Anaerolineae bacterium]
MSLPNPFFHRGPIRDRAYFFGREHETAQALSLLGNGQSISLVGQRRIGKTSLLFHLADPEVFTQHGLSPDEHLFVYFDCGGLGSLDQADLYRVLLEEIADALADSGSSVGQPEPLDDARPLTYRAFERALRRLTRQGWKPIILLDEFERMSHNPNLDPDFFSGLRALAARYPIAYVTASKRPLLELTYADASVLSSPFFNIFASIRLGLFSEGESRDLLSSLVATAQATFTPSTIDFILKLAGPHPLFLQIAGFHAFELRQARGAPMAGDDYPELRRRFRSPTDEHFHYYWRNLTAVEQCVLAILPASQSSQPDIIRRLEQGCLILRRGEGYHYLSPAFSEFVQSQPVAGLLQAGPVAIDESRRQALLHGRLLSLTPTQYDLLVYLVERAGQVLTDEELEQAVWADEYVEDPDRLKSVIKGLRRTLGEEATRLENVRGVGYVWR